MKFPEIQQKLKSFSVGIAGCGGLGSNCAVALARVGIGKLILADFDVVSESNLNRQYFFRDQIGRPKTEALRENLLRIREDLLIGIHTLKLDPDIILQIFRECDVVVEAFDLAEQKEMLIETVLTGLPGMPLVIGLGLAGWGNAGAIRSRKSDTLYICGDEVSEISEEQPPLAPRVGIVANLQADVVLEILLNERREM